MRIVYIISHLGQTGVNNVVMDLVKQFSAHGHECEVWYFRNCKSPMSFPCKIRKISIFSSLDLTGIDVIHFHGLRPNAYGLFHKPCFKKTPTNFIATIHCYIFSDFTDLYGKIWGVFVAILFLISLIRMDKIVALTKDACNYYSRWFSRKKLDYAYNTRDIDTEESLLEEELKEIITFKGDGVLIGMNCVQIKRKGIDIMLEAIAKLPERFRLMLVGDGKEKNTFKKMADKLGVSNRVLFTGKRPNAHRYLRHYDIYALPSRSEGFPLALLEAAVYGKMTVSSDLNVVTECFDDNHLSVFHLPDADALKDAILSLENKTEKGDNLKKHFDDNFSPDQFYLRHFVLYYK